MPHAYPKKEAHLYEHSLPCRNPALNVPCNLQNPVKRTDRVGNTVMDSHVVQFWRQYTDKPKDSMGISRMDHIKLIVDMV